MSTRIEKTFEKARAVNRAALIPFIMGGDPDAATTAALLESLPAAGADIIEIGVPFSDPMADGPVIQAAGRRALEAGATLSGILELVRQFRIKNQDTPLILMGYYNPVYTYGGERFCNDAAQAGIDGVILVDLPPEEEQELTPHLDKTGINLIRLIAPTSGKERARLLCQSAGGFVYYISVTGITGGKTAEASDLKSKIAELRSATALPIAIGFGIKTPQQAREAAGFGDAVVVGSALVDAISKAGNKKAAVTAACDFVSALAKALPR